MIFKNWLDTRPKMETHDPNVYPTILGGISRGFWSLFLDLGPRSAIFWHLKTGTFGIYVNCGTYGTQKYHIQVGVQYIDGQQNVQECTEEVVPISDNHVILLNEYFIKLDTANFNILNIFFDFQNQKIINFLKEIFKKN